MMNKIVDAHTHFVSFPEGRLTPEEMVARALEKSFEPDAVKEVFQMED